MADATFCVTGATGGLGSRTLHHLLHTCTVSPSSIIISTANTKNASLPANVSIRKGDYLDPQSLITAYAGATKLLLVSYPSIAHEIRVRAHVNAIDAALQVGVTHIYYTSLAFAGDSAAAVMQAHIDSEAYLKKSCAKHPGVKYTIIREGIYSESYPLYLGYLDVQKAVSGEDRRVVVPCGAEAGIAWVAKDDLGNGTARIMCDVSGEFDNKTVLLSGAKAIPIKHMADVISGLWGWVDRPLKVEEVGEEEFVKYQVERKTGGKEDKATLDMVQRWATSYPAIEKGELAVVDSLLQRLIGKELKTMEEPLREDYKRLRS